MPEVSDIGRRIIVHAVRRIAPWYGYLRIARRVRAAYGGAVQTFQTLETAPGLEDIWQLHWSYAGGIEHNTAGVMIANIDEREQLAAVVGEAATPPAGAGGMAAHAPAHYLKVTARNDGSFTVTNSRNGYSKTYASKP